MPDIEQPELLWKKLIKGRENFTMRIIRTILSEFGLTFLLPKNKTPGLSELIDVSEDFAKGDEVKDMLEAIVAAFSPKIMGAEYTSWKKSNAEKKSA